MLLCLSDQWPNLTADAPTEDMQMASDLPNPDAVSGAEIFLVVGEISSSERASHLSGVLRRAVPRGATVLAAYPSQPGPHFLRLLREFDANIALTTNLPEIVVVRALDNTFEEYFDLFGRSANGFRVPD